MLAIKIVLAGFMVISSQATLLSSVSSISSRATYKVNPLASNALHRIKRQAMRFNETDLESRDYAAECIMKCLYSMDEKLDGIFPMSNMSKDSAKAKEDMFQEYDPEKFEAFCSAYRPSSECLKQCPDGELKTFAVGGLKMPEILCVTKFEEFKKHLPCLNKVGKEVEKTCSPKCEQYEHALGKLEKMTESEQAGSEIDLDEMRFLFSQSCKYVKCAEDCGQPITEGACGKEAGKLEKLLVSSSFQTINDMMKTFNDVSFDFWPPECQELGQKNTTSLLFFK